jgi:hypothetical protein
LPLFAAEVLPRMQRLGIRVPAAPGAAAGRPLAAALQ